jgi:hypothetical protein
VFDPSQCQMPVCEALDATGRIRFRHSARSTAMALRSCATPAHWQRVGLKRRGQFDLVDGMPPRSGADDENVEEAHGLSPFSTEEQRRQMRQHTRRHAVPRRCVGPLAASLADRARGLPATSSSSGVSGRL